MFDRRVYAAFMSRLRLTIEARREERVHLLAARHRVVLRVSVAAALEIRAGREHLCVGAAILPHEPPQVRQTLPASKGPEGFLAEEQRERGVLCGRRRQGR